MPNSLIARKAEEPHMTFGRLAVVAVTLLLGGKLLSFPAAVPPTERDRTALEKPLWLSVRLDGNNGTTWFLQVSIHAGIELEEKENPNGITISGKLRHVEDGYAGNLQFGLGKSKIWSGFKFALDKPQGQNVIYYNSPKLASGRWTFVLSHERAQWTNLESKAVLRSETPEADEP
jgi:hypothetical protein